MLNSTEHQIQGALQVQASVKINTLNKLSSHWFKSGNGVIQHFSEDAFYAF